MKHLANNFKCKATATLTGEEVVDPEVVGAGVVGGGGAAVVVLALVVATDVVLVVVVG